MSSFVQALLRGASEEAAVLDRVISAIGRILGHAIDKDQPMTEEGLDSLGAVELHRSLELEFTLQLPATLAFDYPTPESLAQHIASAVGMQASYGELKMLDSKVALGFSDMKIIRALQAIACRGSLLALYRTQHFTARSCFCFSWKHYTRCMSSLSNPTHMKAILHSHNINTVSSLQVRHRHP